MDEKILMLKFMNYSLSRLRYVYEINLPGGRALPK
jgi:hypothetical protein